MERTLNLRLHANGGWSAIDDDGGDKLAFQLENNATSIKIQLPDSTADYTHYLQVELPDGTSLLSSAIAETLVDSIRTLVVPVGYPITAQYGRVRIQYVGRKNESQVICSKTFALDVDESLGEPVVTQTNPDFITWTEGKINNLLTRMSVLEGAAARADAELVENQIILGDAGEKGVKSSGKTINDVEQEAAAIAHTDATNLVNTEKERALLAEGGLSTRITALENGESAEVHADSNFTDAEILVADGSGGKKIKSSGKTIATIEGEIHDEELRAKGVENSLDGRITALENGESAEVHADNNFGTDAIILVADGTGKKIKAGSKTIAGVLADAHSDAVAEVGTEKTRAEAAEGLLDGRVTALENAESSHTDAQGNFDANEIVVGVGGSKMVKPSGHTITSIDARITALENGESAEVHADNNFGTDEAILVADGTSGKKLKASGHTIGSIDGRITELEGKKGKVIVEDEDNDTSYNVSLKDENGKLCLYY